MQELERLRRELAEARRECDARGAELRKLYDETRQLRQWRAEFSVLLKTKKAKPLWRALSALRGTSVLDDFMPPPLDAPTNDKNVGGARPLPPVFGSDRSGWCLQWNGGTLERVPFSSGVTTATAITTFLCDGLVTRGANPLKTLREILSDAPANSEIWLIEPDAANLPNGEAATIQYLLLDETEANRPHADHAVDRALFKDVLTELTKRGEARVIDTWTQSNAESGYHLALLRREAPAKDTVDPQASEQKVVQKPVSIPGATIVLLHANPFAFGAGGTEQIALVRTRAMGLAKAILIYPNGAREIVAAEIDAGNIDARKTYTFQLREPLKQYANEHREAEDLVVWIARQFGAASAIVDHLLYWPLRLPAVLKTAGIDYAMVLHDFYAACPSYNLINGQTGALCSTHYGGADCSEQCLATHFAAALHTPGPRTLKDHQDVMRGIIDGAAAIICPDASVQRRAATALNIPADRLKVIPHGLESEPAQVHEKRGPRLRVALLGNLTSAVKGTAWLGDILNRTRELPIDWHVFGRYDGEFATANASATLTRHGPYERAQIVGLLREHAMDAALFTTIAEETFSLTLSEAFCAGVPAIVPDLGALGERVRKSGFGWTVPVSDSAAVLAMLQRLSGNPAERNAIAEKMKGFQHFSPQENAAAFTKVLEPILQRPSPAPLPETKSSWLMRAENYERELTQAFEQSDDERWSLANNSAALEVQGAAMRALSPGVELNATAPRATFAFTPSRFSHEKRHVLMLDVSSPLRDTIEVCFSTLAEPLVKVQRALEVGRQRLCVELTHPLLSGAVRVALASRPGVFTLHDVALRAV